ncbi:D-aminoacyl-tRNA deacylase [Entomomonas asaccharolytica]|uniref:D-aminoacyl-tRNA deacylase n=1 Tax=Entomomonas asaccharolytica TaxID=2785331 RepID=A0A974RWX6_9GAMM|nr:D-aminoacyl-tRNA deacylase [Entomomonas asaccharolytica]QQP85638.1 D-tyrosyl-tRNA(Tyr) deacylase [Entomomonas asaccharolytica]
MKALIQRVTEASVAVENDIIGEIGIGILALVGIEPDDTPAKADKLLHKLLNYRIFADENDKMNCSLVDIKGGLLLVSQFTLAADTKSGLRPSFSTAASPILGEELFNYLLVRAQQQHTPVATGCFGANMQIHLINNGPVTFLLDV